jgi:hypothetical protein
MATSLINTECKRYGCIKNLLACYANCRYSGRCDDLKNEILDKTDQAATDISKYLGERGLKPITIQIMKRGVKFTDIANVKNIIPAKAERQEARIKSEIKFPSPVGVSAKKTSASPRRKKSARRAKPKSAMPLSPVVSNPATTTVNVRKARAASYLEKSQALLSQKPARRRKKRAKTGSANITKTPRRSFELNKKESLTMPKRTIARSLEKPVEKVSVSNITSGEAATHMNSKPKARRKSPSKSRSASRNGKVYIILEGKSASIVDEQGLMQHLFAGPSSGARYFEASEVEARVHIVVKK